MQLKLSVTNDSIVVVTTTGKDKYLTVFDSEEELALFVKNNPDIWWAKDSEYLEVSSIEFAARSCRAFVIK
jgi:hypothetical protein